MTESLVEFARWLERQAWNQPGTDKTWVLNVMSSHLRFDNERRQAKRVRQSED